MRALGLRMYAFGVTGAALAMALACGDRPAGERPPAEVAKNGGEGEDGRFTLEPWIGEGGTTGVDNADVVSPTDEEMQEEFRQFRRDIELQLVDWISPEEMSRDLRLHHGRGCDQPTRDREMIERLSPRR